MADNLSEALKKIISEVAEAAGFMWQRGWAERNAGNISVNLADLPPSSLPSDYQPFFIPLPAACPQLAGMSFLITATNRRMRDLAKQPLRNAVIIRIADDGCCYNIISHRGKTDLRPTSELATHLGIHSALITRGSGERAVLHTHATELIAVTHFNELCDVEKLNHALLSMHPEIKIFLPDGAGFIPYALPGTTAIGELTAPAFRKHNAVIWEKHGIFTAGHNTAEAFDIADMLNKAASIYLLCRRAGYEPEGLTRKQINGLSDIKFI